MRWIKPVFFSLCGKYFQCEELPFLLFSFLLYSRKWLNTRLFSALKCLLAHSCGGRFHSFTSAGATHQQETKFLDFTVAFHVAQFRNKTHFPWFLRIASVEASSIKGRSEPTPPLRLTNDPFMRLLFDPFFFFFLQSWMSEGERSAWGVEAYWIKNREKETTDY